MKILFCGTMVPEEIEYNVKDISAAGSRFQNNLVSNFRKLGHKVQTLSYVGVPLPEGAKYQLQELNEKNANEQYVVRRGNLMDSMVRYRHAAKRYLRDTEIVICYNVIYAWLFLPEWARRYGKKSVAILADYSESVSYHSAAGKLYAKLQLWSMRRFDTVVGLSANIESKLKKSQKFLLMEGGIDGKLYDSFTYRPHQSDKAVVFLYSGLLSRVTGVDLLLSAMAQVRQQDIRLYISGKGEWEEQVRNAEQRDKRIRYLGHLPYEEYVRRLQEADVLINPRNMELSENQNNFPSKIMEYLASGKPIISTRFVGWEKFEDNIVFCDSSAGDLRKHMERAEEALNDADTEAIYRKNRQKAERFQWEKQAEKIISNVGKLDV